MFNVRKTITTVRQNTARPRDLYNPKGKREKLLKQYEKYINLVKHIDYYEKVGFLEIWNKEDYKEFTTDGKLNRKRSLACCYTTIRPYAWRINMKGQDKTFYYTPYCKDHAKEFCSRCMKIYGTKCQCLQHKHSDHSNCYAWKSKGIIGMTYPFPEKSTYPTSIIETLTNLNIDDKHCDTYKKLLGQIRMLTETEIAAQNDQPNLYFCVMYCKEKNGWCHNQATGTITLQWGKSSIEQYYCQEHIRTHCQYLRKLYPENKCFCNFDTCGLYLHETCHPFSNISITN